MRVEDVMTGAVHSCRPTDTRHAVMRLLWDHDIGALPVVDAEGQAHRHDHDRDVAMAAYTQGKALHELLVDWTMSKTIFTAHVGDRLSAAERTMRVHQVHRLPVVDSSDRLVGHAVLNDLARSRAGAPSAHAREQQTWYRPWPPLLALAGCSPLKTMRRSRWSRSTAPSRRRSERGPDQSPRRSAAGRCPLSPRAGPSRLQRRWCRKRSASRPVAREGGEEERIGPAREDGGGRRGSAGQGDGV